MVAARPVSTSSQTSLAARFAESRRETRRTRAPFDRLRVNFSSISTILHLTVLALSERSESKCCRTRTRFSYGKSRGSTPCFPSRPSQATLRFASVAGLGLEPRYHPPEGCVLPLDDPAKYKFPFLLLFRT